MESETPPRASPPHEADDPEVSSRRILLIHQGQKAAEGPVAGRTSEFAELKLQLDAADADVVLVNKRLDEARVIGAASGGGGDARIWRRFHHSVHLFLPPIHHHPHPHPHIAAVSPCGDGPVAPMLSPSCRRRHFLFAPKRPMRPPLRSSDVTSAPTHTQLPLHLPMVADLSGTRSLRSWRKDMQEDEEP
ncbi:hypothetical protein TRIUR3_14377 [Triticum urartu]|uniref:Uncharacterized protein n=1 Tax=Triticum urartu TaxID=4572 RepID=M7ZEN3_TRIUA|nr:hypothetical protein TRIUR3_14377 [Triticum urartu]